MANFSQITYALPCAHHVYCMLHVCHQCWLSCALQRYSMWHCHSYGLKTYALHWECAEMLRILCILSGNDPQRPSAGALRSTCCPERRDTQSIGCRVPVLVWEAASQSW